MVAVAKSKKAASNAKSEATQAPAEKAPVKKKVTKAEASAKLKKVNAKTSEPPKEVSETPEPKAKKDGLRKAQIRILKALVGQSPLSRSELAEAAEVDSAGCVEWIGAHDDEKRLANDVKHFPSLITLGFVKAQLRDVDGKNVIQYHITATGKKTAEKF